MEFLVGTSMVYPGILYADLSVYVGVLESFAGLAENCIYKPYKAVRNRPLTRWTVLMKGRVTRSEE